MVVGSWFSLSRRAISKFVYRQFSVKSVKSRQNVCIALEKGFEEIEAITVANILRRACIDVKLMASSVQNSDIIQGSKQINVETDYGIMDALLDNNFDLIVLPGGMTAIRRMIENVHLKKQVRNHVIGKNGLIGAICGAPLVLAHYGLLTGYSVTCHPFVKDELLGLGVCKHIIDERVCIDRNIITSQGPGTALEFAFTILEQFQSEEKVQALKKDMMVLRK
ncbi:hypothetical protein GJ496_003440 [Pomphorhynchus laevis]|nr:hypothetical protein GJ496_003440 [Pomphorhynchus laevis]